MCARFLVLAWSLFFLAVGAAPPGGATVPIDMESDTSGAAADIAYDRYGKIAFTMNDTLNDGDSLDIFVMNPDGSGQTNLTRNAGPGWDSSPAWSFDGSQIAFVRDSNIWVMSADGSEPRNLNVGGSEPTWSPDGSRIAYTDYLSLWVVSADGSGRTYLAEWGWEPSWSPDGSTIVYSAPVEGESYNDLWTIDIRSGIESRLTNTPDVYERSPDWSPDGSQITFAQRDSGPLGVVDADGSGYRFLDIEGSDPAWSPDGNAIVFNGSHSVVAINVDGSGETLLVEQGPELRDDGLDWGPSDGDADTGLLVGAMRYRHDNSTPPLRGTCVAIWDEVTRTGPGPDPIFVETDANGLYRAELAANRSYLLHFWDCEDGQYEWEFFDGRSNAMAADPVWLGPGSTTYAGAELGRGGRIKGVVTDAAGDPIEDIEVWVRDSDGYWTHWYGLTNSAGEYWVPGLRPGAVHHVHFYDPAESYRWKYYDDQPRFATADDVTVTSDAWTYGIHAALGPWYSGAFSDDDDSVFEADIEWLADTGITRGCNPPASTMYCPDEYVTRGQMAAFLVRALNYTDDGGGNLFIDDNGSVFEADIDKLGTAGVTRGCNPPVNNMFCPTANVTRGQMAAFLVRALGYTDDGGGNLFVDDDGSVFEADIDKLGTAGVTRGCNPPVNNMYCPESYVTRAQMAAFLHRALGSDTATAANAWPQGTSLWSIERQPFAINQDQADKSISRDS